MKVRKENKHIIYKVVNKINNKYYIGYHKTTNIDDDYFGSGKLLKAALMKYGKENFIKEILFIYDNREAAMLKEHELVNENTVKDGNSYNLKIGGEGGWDYINNVLKNDIEYRRDIYIRSAATLKESYASGKLDHIKKETIERNKRLWAEGKLKGVSSQGLRIKNVTDKQIANANSYFHCFNLGKKASEETKRKISENNGNKWSGEQIKNITDAIVNSGVDFKKYGWVGQVAELIGKKPQKVNYIMKKFLPDFYEKECLKRNTSRVRLVVSILERN